MKTGSQIITYRDLIVWKAALELAVDCYAKTQDFPKSELYGMTSQIRRASSSIAANIAEGHGRESTGSFIQFLRIAQGSLKELETLLMICSRVRLIDEAILATLLEQSNEVGRMFRSLIRSLQERIAAQA